MNSIHLLKFVIFDNRLDRIKTSTRDVITVIAAGVALFALFLMGYYKEISIQNWGILLFIVLFVVLVFSVIHYRAQSNAWYAVKEGVLLEKKNKDD